MTDRALITELREAVKRPYVDLTDADRKFVRRLQDRDELTSQERQRAERIFAREVDW